MKLVHTTLALLATGTSLFADELQDQLDARKSNFEKKASEEKITEYNKGIKAVQDSGLMEKALKKGDTAPDFTLKNAVGKEVTLSNLLKDGPVVMTWYRGSWCPYCNIALQSYQKNLPKFAEAGAQFIALTPELPDNSLPTKKKFSLEFEVLTDLNNQVAEKFNIVFKMTPWVKDAMESFAGLNKYNGEEYDSATLPLSATYIITPDRKIAYAFLDAEYRNRATPEMILKELAKLKKAGE
ncbi:AhpC/TSA family protein [Verrucomicrobiaceae bacterium R5-34]|uniref:thioredoxin-dependent peroxiredoxin n=1 Tax=Oceaniferula flava TaxID=2800421 RepID=A0AAE2V889_9BACT|nr:peroxiredoxin-like family protein [Oceaniferula flavus]MBK1830006.1 AhpC/TSA family protein [Verrucomicrobiaceae bacterium R5-34]MBK1855147.1 AhpC/TSA family protein [Oceaniferula flavus]MBM1136453.1 AhpC/TSA family protein [Oceaniferula flavus]